MNELELYDLYDVWYKPWWHSTPAKVFALCGVIALLSLIAWYIIAYVKRCKPMPFWQKALEQCAYLKKSSDSLELPMLYAHLTALLKEYLEKKFAINVKQLTDVELREKVVELPITQLQKDRVIELLTYAVPAKFDINQPDIADPIIHISYLESLITETQENSTPP